MKNPSPSRRSAGLILLILAALGALLILGWALRAALFALGILAKLLFGLGGLLVLGLVLLFLFRGLTGRR